MENGKYQNLEAVFNWTNVLDKTNRRTNIIEIIQSFSRPARQRKIIYEFV